MQITAALAREAGKPLEIVGLELDELRPDEVRVRMVATGVCHTDALVRDQALPTPLPVVLGHEGAGSLRMREVRRTDEVNERGKEQPDNWA